MNIALLTEVINRRSGARAPLEIGKALSKIGHRVSIFAYKSGSDQETIINLKKRGVAVVIINRSNIFATAQISNKIKTGKFDIISFHGTLKFFIGAKLSGIPISTTYYGTQLDAIIDRSYPVQSSVVLKMINYLGNLWIRSVGKYIATNSNKVISISNYCQKEVNNLYGVKSQVVYLGCPQPHKYILKKSNKVVNILSVSRIVPYKGFHKLIKIFNKISVNYPNITLTIIGSSPNKPYLEYLKRISNNKVTFVINADERQLMNQYRSANIYATFDKYLFFGMPVLEAASFGIPSVSMNYCAAAEVIKDGTTGFVSKNEEEFCRNLEKLIKIINLRTKLGKNALKYAENFNWVKTAKGYEKIFNKTSLCIRN